MNSLYQKYKQVMDTMYPAVCNNPTNSCNTKNTIRQNIKAEGLVLNISPLYHYFHLLGLKLPFSILLTNIIRTKKITNSFIYV